MRIIDGKIKKYCSYLLIFICYFSLFSRMNPVINYVIHKDHYKNDLCLERDIPQSCCAGKCQLKKDIEINESPVNNNSAIPIPNIKTEILINWFMAEFNSKIDNFKFLKCRMLYVGSLFESIYIDIITPPPKV